ncbi:MAG: hypothetical protein JOZ00_19730 [Mycobacterium sp.]|uniref:hypothetical protein n=1 Tax=Mycobacterium sp. TaxID=1785 RepID=UPI001ED408B9|nr:hypothetical protein [Mycobacterium sp.]MBV8788905.1 hypothetical protein [Mycobacterium sp.]
MEVGRIGVAGWVVIAVAVGAAITGCGSNNKTGSPPASTTSSSSAVTSSVSSAVTGPPPGQVTDYGFLLIKPADLGGNLTAAQPPLLNPNNAPGVAQLFATVDNGRRVWDTIMIGADPAAAATELGTTRTTYAGKVSGTWQPLAVGSNGTMISGASADNSQATTVLLFCEGKALVTLQFDSPSSDPIDPGVATEIARKQDAAIKTGLPG